MKKNYSAYIAVLILLCCMLAVLTGCNDSEDELGILTNEELYSLEFLRHDWTMEQMEASGLEQMVYDDSGMIFYLDESVEYMYIEQLSDYPISVAVKKNYEGEGFRGIYIGDSFDDVMAKFPQEKNWETSSDGEFYGTTGEGSYGSVYDGLDNYRCITLTETGSPTVELNFRYGVLTQYTFLLQEQ